MFLKTKEAFGGLSNMASGYPLEVNGVRILTSEALYQACRFPDLPDVQRKIIEQVSPMSAKMVGKPYRDKTRPDWDWVRMNIMRWCLRVKLAQNWKKFGDLLLETGSRPIVEESRKDAYWGAKPLDENILVGMNVLGRLLMELREEFKNDDREKLKRIEPLKIPRFRLFGKSIQPVDESASENPARPVELATVRSKVESEEQRELTFKAGSVGDSKSVKPASVLAGLQPYPRYQDSNQVWLGQVPAHWETRPAFGAFVPNHEKNHGMQEKTVLSLSYGRIVTKPPEKLHGLVPESFETYQVVNPGDIVIRTTDLQNDHTSLRVAIARDRGIITSAYLALHVQSGVHAEYGYQFLNVWDQSKAIYGFGSGLRQGLDFRHFKRMPVLVPPPDEQAAIVRFLEHANRKIDGFIRAKRTLIGLLNEQKQAIIHRAVTRGLDPHAPLKSSGIPWLGDIPQHWEVRPFLRCAIEKADYRGATPEKVDSGVFLVTAKNIRKGWIDYETSKEYVRAADYAKIMRRGLPRIGDVLITTEAPLGNIALVDREDVALAQRIIRFRLRSELLRPPFALFSLNSPYFQNQLMERATGSTAQGIKASKLPQLAVAFPTLGEQDSIIAAVDDECGPLTTAIARTEREIALMQEYRTRLVADVVTGKLDVRAAAAKLPDVAAESTPEPADPNTQEEVEAEEAEA